MSLFSVVGCCSIVLDVDLVCLVLFDRVRCRLSVFGCVWCWLIVFEFG